MPDKPLCANKNHFNERKQEDGRKLLQCIACGRVSRTAREHQLPGKTTASHDATMNTLWAYASPTITEEINTVNHVKDINAHNSAPASLQQLVDAAVETIKNASLDGSPDLDSPYVAGMIDLIHELSVQPWHTWGAEVSQDWIRLAIKEQMSDE